MTHDELEQRLWELEYGLLSDEDAAALRAQIAGDSAVGQLHDRVRARLSLLAQAARIEAPRIKMRVPAGEETDSPFAAAPRPIRSTTISAWIRRSANWSLGIATSLLIGLLGWAAWSPATQESKELADRAPTAAKQQYLYVVVDTPQQLSREAKNPIVVSTMAPDGTPQPTELKLRLENQNGTNSYFQDVTTDRRGRAVVELPRTETDAAKLSFAKADGYQLGLQVDLAAAETQYATHLRTDKPRYRPGDMVRYRSVTLSRFGLKADREHSVEFQITDPTGQEVVGSKVTGTTEHGVGNGELSLSAEAAPGQYTLFARSPERAFPEVQRDFTVQLPTPRQYDIDVNWSDAWYAAGGQAQGNLAVRTPSGQPARDVKLNFRAFVDGRQVELSDSEVSTDSSGKAVVQFGLPAQIAASEGDLGIQAGAEDVIWKEIPLQADQVQVDFYPEGGDLTAGVENRVYFHSHDLEGRAVVIRGRVVDLADREICSVATQHDGRSAFRFTPELGATYALAIDDPPAIKSGPMLPPIVEQSHLVLDAGAGVFDGGSPVQLHLRSRAAPAEFLLVAYCRGVTVGQRAGTASDFIDGICDVELPVVAEAAGVLRVTVFDYSKQPPEPLAERLVYRHPQQKLQLQWAGLAPKYATGATVSGQVVTTDEAGQPVSAVLGISAVDDTVLQLAGRAAPRMTTQFMLLGDLERPEKLEDANFYLSAEPTAAVALDLLLGTQGWRRFERIPESRMAGGMSASREGLAFGANTDFGKIALRRGLAEGATAGEAAPAGNLGRLFEVMDDVPRRFDNRTEMEALGDQLEAMPSVPQPARRAAEPASRDWIVAVGFGLLVIAGASAVIRRYPTRNAVLTGVAVVGGLVVLALLVSSWSRFFSRSAAGRLASSPSSAPSLDNLESRFDSQAVPTESARASTLPMKGASDSPAELASPKAGVRLAGAPRDGEPVPATASAPTAPAPAASAPAAPAPAASRSLGPAPSAAPAPVPLPAPRAETPPAPKVAAELGKRTAPVGDPSSKLEQALPTTQKPNETLWSRFRMQSTIEEKATEKLAEAEASSRVKRLDSIPGLAPGGMGGKAALPGSGKVSRGAEPRYSTPARDEQKPAEPTPSMPDRFPVRRYARGLGLAKDKTDRAANDFTESVYWDPLIVTDEQGRADIKFDLPDTATKFRILAEGHLDGKLGAAEQTVAAEVKK